MILSFAYTTPALLAGAKTVTRRDWKPEYAEQFRRRVGFLVDAYDKSPRNGGRKVAEVRILSVSQQPEPMDRMPDSDYEAEGFAWLAEHGHVPPKGAPVSSFERSGFEEWKFSGFDMYVVRFELVRVVP